MEKKVVNRSYPILDFIKILSFSFTFIIWVYMHYIQCNDLMFSYIFIATYCISAITIWNVSGKRLNVFFLFYLTFGLFIGGCFWAHLFDRSLALFEPTFFFDYKLSYKWKLELMDYIISFMIFSVIGYYISKKYSLKVVFTPNIDGVTRECIDKKLMIIFPFMLCLILYSSIQFVLEGLSGGYLSHFVENVNNEYAGSGLSKWLSVFSSILLGLAVTFGKRKTKVLYLGLFGVQALANLFVGSRSSFGVFILFLVWLYSQQYKINILKLFFFIVLGMLLLLWLFSFSIRQATTGQIDISLKNTILAFIYSQGGSLMVFDASRIIQDYPLLPYFQTFLPGVSFVYNLLSGTTLHAYDISFSNYMCYNLNPKMFFNGGGLGWSILSDLYLFSFKFFGGYLILTFLFGYFIGILETWSTKNDFYKYLLVSLATSFLLLPRGGFYSIFPMLLYIFVFWIFFSKHSRNIVFLSKGKI